MRYNDFNQPIGEPVSNFTVGARPNISVLNGESVRIERISLSHFEDLFEVYGSLSSEDSLTYMSFDRFESKEAFKSFFERLLNSDDPYYLSIIDNKSNKVVGCFSLMRIDPKNRVIEVGSIVYSNNLKRTVLATEAQYLLMKYVFEVLCYRRYEWKCDSLNEPSKKAAERLDFTYEGTFRQAIVYKNRNRDTNWYSILDNEWPNIKMCFEKWLSASNFDEEGLQKQSLREMLASSI